VAASQPVSQEHEPDGDLAEDLLGLIFMACHPLLSPDARSALVLKLVCGLSTEEVARSFLTPEPTIAQRIVRAKRTLAAAGVRFSLPPLAERPERLGLLALVEIQASRLRARVARDGSPAVAGDLLCRSGEHAAARDHFLRAAAMTRNEAERATMQRRAAECAAKALSRGSPRAAEGPRARLTAPENHPNTTPVLGRLSVDVSHTLDPTSHLGDPRDRT
jgi:predicted RNA polymerase sigma factor